MRILGLDIATVTGVAFYDTTEHVSKITAWSFRLKGDTDEQKASDMGVQTVGLIRKYKPDFIAIESPLKNIVTHKRTKQTLVGEVEDAAMNPASIILPNQLTGAVMAIIGAYRIPWHTVPSSTWRKCFLGFARKPGWSRKDWKRAVREQCDMLGIHVTNDDSADAVGTAFSAPSTQTYKLMMSRGEM